MAAGGGVEAWAWDGLAGAVAGCPVPDDAEAAAWRGSKCHHVLQNPPKGELGKAPLQFSCVHTRGTCWVCCACGLRVPPCIAMQAACLTHKGDEGPQSTMQCMFWMPAASCTWHPSHARHPRPWQLHALGTPALVLQGLLHRPALLALHECSSHRVLMEPLLPWQSCKEAAATLHEARVSSGHLSHLGARQAPWMKQASKLTVGTHHNEQG